jgi:hypothetical protein
MIGPIRLFIKSSQSGGNPDEVLSKLSTNKNKYIRSKDKKYIFAFNDVKNIHSLYGSNFLAHGANTSVFSIVDLHNVYSNILLKLTDETPQNFLTCIEKQIDDKHKYPDNIITVHMWGMLYDTYNKYISNFMIVTEYNLFTETNIKSLSIQNRLDLIYNFTELLKILIDTGIYLRDMKMANIGYDIVDGKYKVVIIDYDELTTLDNNDIKAIIDKENNFGIIMSSGTYVPYYLIKHYKQFIKLNKKIEKFNTIKDYIKTLTDVDDAKSRTFNEIITTGEYKGSIKIEIENIFDDNIYIPALISKLFTRINYFNSSEYIKIIMDLTKEFDKVTSVPLALLIAVLMYDTNPIHSPIKINEYKKFIDVLPSTTPIVYETSFSHIETAQSILHGPDNEIIKNIILGLLKPDYANILSYKQVLAQLDKLSYFSHHDNILEFSPDSPKSLTKMIKNNGKFLQNNLVMYNPIDPYDMVGGKSGKPPKYYRINKN